MFPNGDISGKFGAFTGPSQQLNVTELPTYGRFSTLGLTMREVNTNVSLDNDNYYFLISFIVQIS